MKSGRLLAGLSILVTVLWLSVFLLKSSDKSASSGSSVLPLDKVHILNMHRTDKGGLELALEIETGLLQYQTVRIWNVEACHRSPDGIGEKSNCTVPDESKYSPTDGKVRTTLIVDPLASGLGVLEVRFHAILASHTESSSWLHEEYHSASHDLDVVVTQPLGP